MRINGIAFIKSIQGGYDGRRVAEQLSGSSPLKKGYDGTSLTQAIQQQQAVKPEQPAIQPAVVVSPTITKPEE